MDRDTYFKLEGLIATGTLSNLKLAREIELWAKTGIFEKWDRLIKWVRMTGQIHKKPSDTSIDAQIIAIANMRNLTILNRTGVISPDDIKEVIPEIGLLRKLKYVNLRGVDKIPNSICRVSGITMFNITNSNLTKLPKDIGNLGMITSMNLSNNKLNSIPKSFTKLSNIHTLTLTGNKFAQRPQEVSKLNLKYLDI